MDTAEPVRQQQLQHRGDGGDDGPASGLVAAAAAALIAAVHTINKGTGMGGKCKFECNDKLIKL